MEIDRIVDTVTGLGIYYPLLVYVCLQRGIELFISARNRKALLAAGGRIIDSDRSYRIMVATHVAWLVGCLVEPLIGPPSTAPSVLLIGVATGVLVLGQSLRFWALLTLGRRWNTRVVVGGAKFKVMAEGPYKYIRHPNYLAVILEIAALPLIGGAYLTALLASVTNSVVLAYRISDEDRALCSIDGYEESVGKLPALLPRI